MTAKDHLWTAIVGLLVLACWPAEVHGQAGERQPQVGRVLHAGNAVPVPYVHVLNLAIDKGTTTNAQGLFSIPVRAGDTLRLSAIGFRDTTYRASGRQAAGLMWQIHLHPRTYAIDSVNIIGRKFDPHAISIIGLSEDKYDIPTSLEKEPPKALPPTAMNMVSFLYERLSPKKRLEREGMAFIRVYEMYEKMDSLYHSPAVERITGLQGAEIYAFKRFCNLPLSVLATHREYEVLLLIKRCHEDYKRRY